MGKDCVYLKSRKGQDQQNRKKKKKEVSDSKPKIEQAGQPLSSNCVPTHGMTIVTNSTPQVHNPTSTPHSIIATTTSSSSSSVSHNETPLPASAHGSSPLLTHHFNPMAYSEREMQDPTTITMVLSSFVHSMNFKYTAHKLLDLYYRELCAGFALVDKSLMEGLIDQLMGNDNMNTSSSLMLNHMQLDSTTQDGLVSILYSILALSLQQSGDYVLKGEYRQKVMEYMHNASKDKISKYFDNMDNIYVAVALYYLSDYLCGEGDLRKTSLYLAMVKQMIGLHGYGGPNDQQVGAAHACYSTQDNPSLPKFLLRILVRYKDTFLSDYTSKQSSNKSKLFGVFASRVKLDTSFIDREKGNIDSHYLPHIEHVVQIAHTYYSLLFETMYQAQGDLFCIFSNIFIREFYLDLYSKIENVPAEFLVSFANDIISYTKMEKYIFAPYVVANGIAKAVTVRLEYWRQSCNPVDFKDDLRALRVLSTRYGVVQKLYGDLIHQIENAILLQSMSNNNTPPGMLLTSGLAGVNPPLATNNVMPTPGQPIFAPSTNPQTATMTGSSHASSSHIESTSIMDPSVPSSSSANTENETDVGMPSFEFDPNGPLMDPFNSAGNANLLSMLFNEVENERGDSLNEESYFMDMPPFNEAQQATPQDRDHNPFIKGYHVVKMMIKQLSRLKEALQIQEPKSREDSLKKAKGELIEELSKALPNDIEAKFILELTKHQHPHQIHPCQYSHLALLFE